VADARGHDAAPERLDPNSTTYASTGNLANARRRASVAHGRHEAGIGKADPRIGEADPDWPDGHVAYMVAEQAGTPLPE